MKILFAMLLVTVLVGCSKTHTEIELCRLATDHQITCDVVYTHGISTPWGVVCRAENSGERFAGTGITREQAISDVVNDIIDDKPLYPAVKQDDIATIGPHCPVEKP